MSKHGEDNIMVLHPALRNVYLDPEKALGLDKDKMTIEALRDSFRKNCIALIGEFANAGKPKLEARQLILAYHLARKTVSRDSANEVKALIETSPYFDFHPNYMLPLLRPVKSDMTYHKASRGFRMLAVVFTPDKDFKLLDWSLTLTFTVEYVLRRHKITKKYEDFVALNQELEKELLSVPTLPLSNSNIGTDLQEYMMRLHTSLADRGVFSPRLMKFLELDYEKVQFEEEQTFVHLLDSSSLPTGTAWHFIDERWLERWRLYACALPPRRYFPPGPIDNYHLLEQWQLFIEAQEAEQREAEASAGINVEEDKPVGIAQRLWDFARKADQQHHHHGDDQHRGGRMRRFSDVLAATAESKSSGKAAAADAKKAGKPENKNNNNKNNNNNNNAKKKGDDPSPAAEDKVPFSPGKSSSSKKKMPAKAKSNRIQQHKHEDGDTDDDHDHDDDNENDDHDDNNEHDDGEEKGDDDGDEAKADEQESEEQENAEEAENAAEEDDEEDEHQRARSLALPLKRQQQHQHVALAEVPKLQSIKDYRCVNYNVWRYLQLVHGGGPVISRELSDLYSKVAYSFLHAVVLIQTRMRIVLARLRLRRLQLRQLSGTYAGKLLLVREARQVIQARAEQQLEVNRQQRIAKNLDTAATFTQNLWRLKKKYFLEEALVDKRKEQEAFRVARDLNRNVPSATNNEVVVPELKPVIQVGNTNLYTRVLRENSGGLPFTLQRVPGTQQAKIVSAKDETIFHLHSTIVTINDFPTNTKSYAEIKEMLATATFPMKLELQKPFDARLVPSIFTVVALKIKRSSRFAIFSAFKLAMLRGVRVVKHHGNNMLTSRLTILRINDRELLYQSKSKNPDKEWTRISLLDIKFVRDGHESDTIRLRQYAPGQRPDPDRCFELVLEEKCLTFEFPSLEKELQSLESYLRGTKQQLESVNRELHSIGENAAGARNSERPGGRSVRFDLTSAVFSSVADQMEDSFEDAAGSVGTSSHHEREQVEQARHSVLSTSANLFHQKRSLMDDQHNVEREINELRTVLDYHRELCNAEVEQHVVNSIQSASQQRVEAAEIFLPRREMMMMLAANGGSGGDVGAAGVAANKKKAGVVDDEDDNVDMDAQDWALCRAFSAKNDAWVLKRVMMTNLKRLISEIRGTQVFVNKAGVPVRRRTQKAALKRVEL